MAEAKEIAQQKRSDYQKVFGSEEGLRVLEDLKKTCFYYSPTIHEFPHVMSYNEGQRNVMIHIETQLKLTAVKVKELEHERGQTES